MNEKDNHKDTLEGENQPYHEWGRTCMIKELEVLRENAQMDDDFWEWYEDEYGETKREVYGKFEQYQIKQQEHRSRKYKHSVSRMTCDILIDTLQSKECDEDLNRAIHKRLYIGRRNY